MWLVLGQSLAFGHGRLEEVYSPLEGGQFLIQLGQFGPTGHVCKGEHGSQLIDEDILRHVGHPVLLTERIQEIGDSLDAGRNHFDVFTVRPVLVDLLLDNLAMGGHGYVRSSSDSGNIFPCKLVTSRLNLL